MSWLPRKALDQILVKEFESVTELKLLLVKAIYPIDNTESGITIQVKLFEENA